MEKNNKIRNDERVRNFYYLLAYAFEDEKIHFDKNEEFGKEKFENIYDLFAIILYMRMSEIIKEGLYKEYINYNEELYFIRGRIDIINTIRNNTIKMKNKVICNYDDYSENNILNQIVKTTLYKMLNLDLMSKNRNYIKKIFYSMDNIDVIQDIKSIQWNNISFNRLNNRYEFIIKICEFLLNEVIINKENENEKLKKFDDDQPYHALFEKFIRNYLNLYYRRIYNMNKDIAKSEIMDWDFDSLYKDEKNRELVPKMHTDVTVTTKNRIEIIDAKFYKNVLSSEGFRGFKKENIHGGNWYQLHAYVSTKREKVSKNIEVSGMLLYARTSEKKVFPEVDVKITGKRMRVKTIDFTQKFGNPYKNEEETISKQMNDIAEEIIKNSNTIYDQLD